MLPERFEVGHRVRSMSHDGMSQVESWAEPVPVRVYGWAPPAPDDVVRVEQTGVTHQLDVYALDLAVKHRDVLVINGVEWFVQGEPDDYRFGPFGFRPGVRVRVFRAVG